MSERKFNNNKLCSFISSLFFGIMAGNSAYAADIEIYTGSAGGEAQSNVMFIVDTSGSMSDENRMDQLKVSLSNTLDSLPNDLRVGLTTYNNEGGSINYPAERLDNLSSANVNRIIELSEDDGYEFSDGTISKETENLLFTSISTKRVEVQVDGNSRDAEQCSDGTGYSRTNHYYLDLVLSYTCYYYNNTNNIGTIFRNLDIPKNAKIINAYLEYTHADYYNTENQSDVEIVIEDNPKVSNYSSSAYSKNNVISRDLYNLGETENVGKISWLPLQSKPRYTKEQSPNIAPLIQAMVNHNKWNQNNNAINLIARGIDGGRKGFAVFYTHDAWNDGAAKLIVEYQDQVNNTQTFRNSDGIVSTQSNIGDEYNTVGLNFSNIQIPSSVDIDNAYLEIHPIQSSNSGQIKVKLIKTDDSYSITNNPYDITSREVVDIFTHYISNMESGKPYRIDLSDSLENYIKEDNWCGGSSIMITLESEDISGFKSFESNEETRPRLFAKYAGGGSEDSCGLASGVTSVSSINDDGYVNSRGNNFTNQSTLLIGGGNTTALRFENLELSSQDVVSEAYVEFSSALTSSTNFELMVYADVSNNNNPESYYNTNGNSISDRIGNLIGGYSVTVPFLEKNQKVQTTNIAPIINDIISRSNWFSGNSVSIFFKSVNGSNIGYTYAHDYDSITSPKLYYKVKRKGEFQGVTVREKLKSIIQTLIPNSGTPTLGSTLETYDYYLGNPVNFGKSRYNNRYKFVSSEKSFVGGETITPDNCDPDSNYNSSNCSREYISGDPVYVSPITNSTCQTNNIIMITDGYPTTYRNNYNRVRNLTGKYCNNEWDCIFELTEYLAENDHFKSKDGVQNIMTNVIGFDFDDNDDDTIEKLKTYAAKGHGQFYNVKDSNSLSTALDLITSNILDIETTIATPGVSVNQNNKFQYLNDLYYSVFKPSKFKSWNGNLKKYKIIATDNNGTEFDIIDQNGDKAIDDESGFFREESQSYWSSEKDGKSVINGGASEHLTSYRNLFTYTENSRDLYNVSLNKDEYKLEYDNNELNLSDFGITESLSNKEYKNFMYWVEGKDVNDQDGDGSTSDSRNLMGDPLHSQPMVVRYNENSSTVFVGTNEGILQGFDTETGNEIFGFVPKELLPNLYKRYKNTVGEHMYGVDNTWIAYKHDEDNDGTIGNNSKDFVYIYGGLRRGGNSIFALDVTNINSSNTKSNAYPKVKWIIDETKNDAYKNIGQSWSVPVLTKIKYNGEDKIVMLFSGGYDTSHDNDKIITNSDNLGNQIYMVDAENGELLWWSSNTNSSANEKIKGMDYSITGKITILDINNDSYLDYFYVGDLGGQVLKYKINHDNRGSSNLADGKIFAKLGKTDSQRSNNFKNNRRIFEKITTVPVLQGVEKYMAIVVGTGYRAKPLTSTTEDGVFVIKDKEIMLDKLGSTSPILIENLYDATYDIEEESLDFGLSQKDGYVIWFKEGPNNTSIFLGEKVMGEIVAFNGSLLFSTYFPQSEPKGCTPVSGVSRSYSINLLNGTPDGRFDDESEELKDETENQKRYIKQKLPGIASGTKILYTQDGVIALTNTDAKGLGMQSGLGVYKSSWYPKSEKDTDEDENYIPPHLRNN